MIFSYNGFQHAQNEVSFTISRTALKSQAGFYYGYKEHWACRGLLLNYSTQQEITAAIQQIQNVYAADGGNVIFYLDDGVTPTAHVLISDQTDGGVKVVEPPSFPDTLGTAEYQPSAGRSYSFALEAEVPLTDENVTLRFTESVQIHGTGGPINVWIPLAQGPWIRQQTSQSSTFRVVQAGSALGLYGTPAVPPPLDPGDEIQQLRQLTIESAQRLAIYDWPVSWSYTFESGGQIQASPSQVPSI